MRSVKRAEDAFYWMRREGRANMWGRKHQAVMIRFIMAGLEAGDEQGKIVAAKAIEAYRQLSEATKTDAGGALSRAIGDARPSDDSAA
jgi:hypothetical protein